VLEVASGSGEHAVHFARTYSRLDWQPSDPDPEALASIAAWSDEAGLANLREPILIDASAGDWPMSQADAVLCINMVHISPVAATEGLVAGAARLLAAGAPFILYGPYLEADVETAPSNLAFDRSQGSQSRMGPALGRMARRARGRARLRANSPSCDAGEQPDAGLPQALEQLGSLLHDHVAGLGLEARGQRAQRNRCGVAPGDDVAEASRPVVWRGRDAGLVRQPRNQIADT